MLSWRRAILSVLVAWVPLLILAQVQGLAIGTGSASLLQDFAAYSRFLVAVPLLVIAEAQARPLAAARSFATSSTARLIAPEDDARFQELLASTRRLLSSRFALVAILALSLRPDAGVRARVGRVRRRELDAPQPAPASHGSSPTPAGGGCW